MIRFSVMFFLVIVTMEANKLFAREDSLHSYQVYLSPCKCQPIIDGILNDSIWHMASSISSFTQREPNEGAPASESTKVFISFDENNLYFGIRCHESDPGRIVANEMRRDADSENDDRIEILLDTFDDGRNAFFFSTNPLGMQLKTSFHLNFEAEYQHNRIRLPLENGNFSTNLLIGRVTWAVTTSLFNKLFVQWNDADKKVNLYFLFNYRYMPGSDVYLVYNEQWDAGTTLRTKNRTLIAKLTYILNY